LTFWVYKCNSLDRSHQRLRGDWNKFFSKERDQPWGSKRLVPALDQIRPGDTVIAYQTNRNELVGLAQGVRNRARGPYKDRLILRPLETIRARVRPLKKADSRIAGIRALQGGVIGTVYEISRDEAERLLRAAREQGRSKGAVLGRGITSVVRAAEAATRHVGAGFGTSEQNRKVERGASKFVQDFFERGGWRVQDVSGENRGFDLICTRRGSSLHVEVKGVGGTKWAFILTENERKAWIHDGLFELVLVTEALSRRGRSMKRWRGRRALKEFALTPLSYVVTYKGAR